MEDVNKLHILAESMASLVAYRSILDDPVMRAMLAFLQCNDTSLRKNLFGKLYAELLKAHEKNRIYTSDAWRNHLLNLILWEDNPCTRQGAKRGAKLSESWYKVIKHDLIILQELFQLKEKYLQSSGTPSLSWGNLELATMFTSKHHQITNELVGLMLVTRDWTKIIELLLAHYKKLGVGIFGKYHTLYWDAKRKKLCGVYNQDNILQSQIFGYEKERNQVIDNTLKFIYGYPANNVLLYGDRGTGKSSTVKALINQYSDLGLRIIELKKSYLNDFSIIIRELVDYPYKFIIFLDDLSFEEHEIEYKALKAAFEGGLEAIPSHVLVYATSNRRHIIRESFAEREDDIHKQDTVEEKMSLVDRFGLQVAFQSPSQELYLKIVQKLAQQRELNIDILQLEKLAIQWELHHSGRSGRIAKQLIDFLEGNQKLMKRKIGS